MIIILEGPDGSGKTTQADAIDAQFRSYRYPDTDVFRLAAGPPDPPDYSPFDEYELDFLAAVPDAEADDLIICDRWSLGEAVYGPLLRSTSRLSPGGLLHCEMFFEARGALRWMMMPSAPILVKRLQQRGDDLIDTEDLTAIRQVYTYLAPRYCYSQIHDQLDEMTVSLALKTALARAERFEDIDAAAPGYIGAQHPVMVLAGDVRSTVLDEDPYTAAFTPARAGSAQYLMDALATSSRHIMKHAGILNTGEPGMDLGKAHEVLGYPQWVALGSHAAERLLEARIYGFQTARHPSYMRRFLSKDISPQEYAHSLMRDGGLAR